MKARIFVSYSRKDQSVVFPIIETLRASGFDFWIDQEGIEGASFWRTEIVHAITQSPVILFFASPESFKSDAVAKELALASEERKPILPVYISSCKPPSALRYQIAGLQHIDYWNEQERAHRQLVASLSRITGIEPTRASEFPQPNNTPKSRKAWSAIAVSALLIAISIGGYFWSSWSKSLHLVSVDKSETVPALTRDVDLPSAPQTPMPDYGSQNPEKIALVVANAQYVHAAKLQNAVTDGREIAKILEHLGFKVTIIIDASHRDLEEKIKEHYSSHSIPLTRGLSTLATAHGTPMIHIAYYSGHGVEYQGTNYMLPIDAKLVVANDLRLEGIPIEMLMPSHWGKKARNTLMLYATSPGQVAMDGRNSNSPFTRSLLENLRNPYNDVFGSFLKIVSEVRNETSDAQVPWVEGTLEEPLFLARPSVESLKGGVSIAVIDACRDNPIGNTR